MKLILFDFECINGHEFEELVKSDVHEIECPRCRAQALRQISGTRVDWRRMGVDPDFPGAANKWTKMQEQKARQEESYNLVHY